MQKVDSRVNNYKQFLVKNENEAIIKKLIFDFFFQLKFLLVFFFKLLNIVCLDQSQKSHSFYKKKLQSLMPKKDFR